MAKAQSSKSGTIVPVKILAARKVDTYRAVVHPGEQVEWENKTAENMTIRFDPGHSPFGWDSRPIAGGGKLLSGSLITAAVDHGPYAYTVESAGGSYDPIICPRH